ncbi:unnamed protein product [Ascophyllum nodosum]
MWMRQHGVRFGTKGEFERRLQIFAENSDLIEVHNAAGDEAMFTLGHNEFSHLSWEEFKDTHFGYNRRPQQEPAAEVKPSKWSRAATSRRRLTPAAELPDEVDWERDGAVAPVQNQGMCGSCWAFSAIGAMEGAYFMANQELVKFSEEQVVDCDKVDQGCMGGDMGQAFDWMKDNGGVCTEEDYPYAGLWPPFKTCYSTCSVVEGTEVKEWAQVDATDEALMEALANVGPVAIAIEADQMAFQFYSSGVFTASCGSKLDHGVLVVGYGTEDGTDFWKVKNSWGNTWGMNGYILLERSDSEEKQGGECGLLIEAVYPILESELAYDFWFDPASVIQRPEGFESSASAKDCGGGTTDVIFSDVTVSPSSPKRGKTVTVTAVGTLTKPVSSGTYNLHVKLGSSEVYKHEGPICGDSTAKLPLGLGSIDLHGLGCPANPGPVTFSAEVTLPSIAPPGTYDISVSGADNGGDGSSALCLDVKLEL